MADYAIGATFLLKQYQYKDIVKVEPGDVFLDVGACFGDTSLWAVENGASQSHAFEIDKMNIEALQKNFARDPEKFRIVPYACSDENTRLYYIPHPKDYGMGKISAVLPAALKGQPTPDYYQVSTITIDDYCEQNNVIPNFIKMDIEGAEPLALRGCEKTLKKYQPKFAVCIYHAWPHRWTIPLYLNDILPDYDFYVKKSHPYAETVFFGKPRERTESGEYETLTFLKD